MVRLASLLTLLLLLAPTLALAGQAVVLVKADGTRVQGELLEQSSRGFLINGESGLFLVPFEEVSHVEYRDGDAPAETPPAEGEPATEPEAATDDPTAEPTAAPTTEAQPPDPEAAPQGSDDAGSWIVVQRTDGTTVSGTLVEQTPHAVVVQAGPDIVTVPFAEVKRIASGSLSDPTTADDPPPAAAPASSSGGVPPPPVRRSAPQRRDPVAAALERPEFGQYAEERLHLLDRHGFWLGPRSLGYARNQLRDDNKAPFYAVVASDPEYRLTFSEFLDLTGDDRLRRRYEGAISRATARSQVGVVMLAVGGGLLVASTASMIVSGAGLDNGEGFSVGTPLMLAGVPHIAMGTALFAQSGSDQRRLAGFDLNALFARDQALRAVQRYNAHLRNRYGLPDSQKLDAANTE